MGEVRAFDTGKPDEKLHIVFSFDSTKDTAAVYDVKREGKHDGPDPFLNTAPHLTKWIKENWKTIEYSLAGVTPNPAEGAVFLTPERIAFTVYPTSDGSSGCLSLYIKTKDSGNQEGYASPAFRLSSGDSIPIPSDHTASIIIRRELVQAFLAKALKNATVGGKKAMGVTQKSTTTGFEYTSILEVPPRKHRGTSGSTIYMADPKWSFKDSPLDVVITNNKARWRLNFENIFQWSSFFTHRGHDGGPKTDVGHGKVKFTLRVDQTSTVLSLDEKKVTAKFELGSGYWTRGIEKVGRDEVPGSVAKWLNTWSLPSFSSTMRLDFFATTNVLAPGKHIIDIDTAVGALTPYDLLIVGNVVDPSTLLRPSSDGDISQAERPSSTSDPESGSLPTLGH